jgi:hypothetical protein
MPRVSSSRVRNSFAIRFGPAVYFAERIDAARPHTEVDQLLDADVEMDAVVASLQVNNTARLPAEAAQLQSTVRIARLQSV